MGIVIVNVKRSAGGALPLGGPGACPLGNFPICGPQKWHLLDSEHKFLAILASIEASISKKGSSKSRVPGNFYGVPSLTSQLVYQPEVGAVDAFVQKMSTVALMSICLL